MIDIIKGLQQRNPALGPYVLVLRSDSRARDPSDPSRLCAEAEAWIAEKAPGARLSQETVLIAPYPGAMPADRTVAVMAFKDAMQLAAFATAWTADPEPEDEANEDEAGEVEAAETAPNEGTGPEAAPQAVPTGA